MRTHGLPYCLIAGNRMTLSTQMTSGLISAEHAGQVLLRPFGAVDDRRPAILHVVVDLVVGRFAEVRDVAVDEVLPELGHLLGRHRRRTGSPDAPRSRSPCRRRRSRDRTGTRPCGRAPRRPARCRRNSAPGRRRLREKCDRLLRHRPLLRNSVCENSGVGRVPADLDRVADADRPPVGGVGGDADQERLCRTARCGREAAGRARDRRAPRPCRWMRLAVCARREQQRCARAAPRPPPPRRPTARCGSAPLIRPPSAGDDAAAGGAPGAESS